MTVIKLGRNTYRVYYPAAGVSYLFTINKHGVVVLKRTDAPDEFVKGSPYWKEVALTLAYRAMNEHIAGTARMWEDQGYLMGSQA